MLGALDPTSVEREKGRGSKKIGGGGGGYAQQTVAPEGRVAFDSGDLDIGPAEKGIWEIGGYKGRGVEENIETKGPEKSFYNAAG